MIIIYHKTDRVLYLESESQEDLTIYEQKNVVSVLFALAFKNPESILVWCDESQKEYLNVDLIKSTFTLKNLMLSFNKTDYLPNQIGYVEDSPFLKVNKRIKYPTWFMSSQVGAIYASQLLKFKDKIKLNETFDFTLNTIAKIGMSKGLFCYSEPNLLTGFNVIKEERASVYKLFKFVKLHYKAVWSVLLLVNFIIHERKCPLIPFLRTIFIRQIKPSLEFNLEPLEENKINLDSTIDVIIPTLGRKEYVHDFLIDLSSQSLLPQRVIVIEQNENKEAISELNFISDNTWPFKIIHEFIHQTGACNARNIGLKSVQSNYVFLADDDIRIETDLIESALKVMRRFRFSAVTLSCLNENDTKQLHNTIQWSTFGSGCSIVEANRLKNLSFNMSYEFGYGEDVDFGMQLRNIGTDIIYIPQPEIKHLKAPIGGFRSKFIHPWEVEKKSPKPSPTVMLNRFENTTKQQLLGYKTRLFLQFYNKQKIKNPLKYFKTFRKQWNLSEFWAKKINKQHNL